MLSFLNFPFSSLTLRFKNAAIFVGQPVTIVNQSDFEKRYSYLKKYTKRQISKSFNSVQVIMIFPLCVISVNVTIHYEVKFISSFFIIQVFAKVPAPLSKIHHFPYFGSDIDRSRIRRKNITDIFHPTSSFIYLTTLPTAYTFIA